MHLATVTHEATKVEPWQGIALLIGFGLAYLAIALYTNYLKVKDTHDFIIANRQIGWGLGFASLIAVWTWSNAVLTSSAVTYAFGISGTWWFVGTNGLNMMLLIPFARRLRRLMPHGYTIAEFAKVRFGDFKNHFIFILSMIFGGVVAAIINLKALTLLISTIFSVDASVVAVLAGGAVLLYSIFGGLWTTATTGTIQTFLITVPAVILFPIVYAAVGGTDAIGKALSAQPDSYRNIFDPTGAISFGILFFLGNCAFSLADQPYWQKIWGIKRKFMERVFLWAGFWYFPIPLALASLGLVGIALGADLNTDLAGDAGNVGPWVVSHLGLPAIIVILYVTIIIAACYSSMDGGYSALSSIVAVDVLHTYRPKISQRNMMIWTRVSMAAGGLIGVLVVLTNINLIPLVLTLYALKVTVLFPLVMAIYWRRMSAAACFWGIVASIAIGMPIYIYVSGWLGTWAIIGISIVVPIIITLIRPSNFDFNTLRLAKDVVRGAGREAA
jgi:urea-proton symporter